MSKIHPTAIIESGAELGVEVEVGPFTHIQSGAKIGNGAKIHSHVSVWGQSDIGDETEIFPFCSIGAPPQIIGDPSPTGRAILGRKNVIRESVQIHRGSSRDDGITRLGDNNYIMASVHIGHDCKLGSNIILASFTGLAGHVKIDDFATLSGGCGVAQFTRVGSYTYCAGHSRFNKDLPPYMCAREFDQVTSPNLVGLKRAGFSAEDQRIVKEIYKTLFLSEGTLKAQMEKLAELYQGKPVFDRFAAFVSGSKNGIMRRKP